MHVLLMLDHNDLKQMSSAKALYSLRDKDFQMNII